MNIICLIGHRWRGCICERCNTKRDADHDWHKIPQVCKVKCHRCGATKDVEHDWRGCKCEWCGAKRDVKHDWQHKGFCRFECQRCGAKKEVEHDWIKFKCKCCGATVNQLLDSDDASVRHKALLILAQAGDPETFRRLSEMVGSANPTLCIELIDAVGKNGEKISVEKSMSIASCALKRNEPQVRKAAVLLLGLLLERDTDAGKEIVRASSDPDPGVRLSVLEALRSNESLSKLAKLAKLAAMHGSNSGSGDASYPFLRALDDEDDAVREKAIAILGELGLVETVQALLKLSVCGERRSDQSAATAALERFDWRSAITGFCLARDCPETSIRAALPPLLEKQAHRIGFTDVSAKWLGGLESLVRAAGTLLYLTNDPDPAVVAAAQSALKRVERKVKAFPFPLDGHQCWISVEASANQTARAWREKKKGLSEGRLP